MAVQINDDGTSWTCPLLLVVAVFTQIATCNCKVRVDRIEKQQAEIQAEVIEIRQRLPKSQ